MEMYILDSLLRRTKAVDKFESLIWTERWREYGDFELDLKSTLENRNRFLVGTHLALNNSHRVMTVETVEDSVDDSGKEKLLVKGRSLEALLEDRVAMYSLSTGVWTLNDTPGNVVRAMFDHICRAPAALDPNDVIPFLLAGSIFSPGTIDEPAEIIEWEQLPDSLYNAIKKICTLYDLGFRLVRNFDTSELYFDVYTGSDRSTKQTALTPVIFATGLDNIQNTTEFTNIQKTKNVAYVYSENGDLIVYGEDVDSTVEGFDRRVIIVQVTVDADHPDIPGVLAQHGKEALMDNRASILFDSEIDQRAAYTYGVDYDLGDLVEMRNKDGVITYKRVTEQIFVSDSNGERSYPTLSLGTFIGADTWLSYGNKSFAWDEFGDEYWEDM